MGQTNEDAVREYLGNHASFRALGGVTLGPTYFGPEDLLIDRGSAWTEEKGSAKLTVNEAESLYRAVDMARGRFQIKECFYNSQRLMIHDHSNQIEYWEGYALGNAPIPVHHGWNVINGKVVDLTLRMKSPRSKGRLRNRVIGVVPTGWVYIGIQITQEKILDTMNRTGMAEAQLYHEDCGPYDLPRLGEPPVAFPKEMVQHLG
jgi:hypothetical protein